jgi:hypothetical protein
VIIRFALAAVLAAGICTGAIGGAGPARADDPDYLALGAGAFDAFRSSTIAGEFRAEYRSKLKWWIFKPFTGVMATSEGSFYGFGGLLLDVYLGRRLVVTPSFAAGLYVEGGGKDLGHVIEFRSQVEVAYRFEDRSRLGVSFSHISNASIASTNPGAESLMLTYSMPFSRLLGR